MTKTTTDIDKLGKVAGDGMLYELILRQLLRDIKPLTEEHVPMGEMKRRITAAYNKAATQREAVKRGDARN